MAFYLVGGKLGSGKSLCCVGVIRDALRKGRKVATNLDLYLEKMLPRESRATVIRLPDKPSAADLVLIGQGQEGMEETDNGVLVLDECASWLNARTWNDPQRELVMDWFRNSRKYGWDVYLIAQHIDQLDKQARTSVVEFNVRCARLDRLPIPGITTLVKILTVGMVRLRAPKVHMATVRYGVERESLVVDRWTYRARDLYACYDTKQVFRDAHMLPVKGEQDSAKAAHVGIHSMLSPWHLFGRHCPRVPFWRRWLSAIEPQPRVRPLFRPEAYPAAVMRLAPDLRWRFLHNLSLRSSGIPVRPLGCS